ncbi:MAG TPA: methyltransferase domain-containing protein [Verrucomicrobiae bacterium]
MDEWRKITDDPNEARVVGARQAALARARGAGLLADRVDYLCERARGKRVLDIGVVDHRLRAAGGPGWLHGRLCEVAAECEGVDVLPGEIAELQRRGFSVSCFDVAEARLPRTFDVIVCGDVLEHIDEPGPFLTHCGEMLTEEGVLILTLPNPWYLNVIIKALFGRQVFQENVDHVAWYDPGTLYELADRCGLDLVGYAGVRVRSAKGLAGRVFFRLLGAGGFGLRREVLAKTMVYELRRKRVQGERAGARADARHK